MRQLNSGVQVRMHIALPTDATTGIISGTGAEHAEFKDHEDMPYYWRGKH